MDFLTGVMIVTLIVAVIHRMITGHWLGEGKGKTRVTRGRWRVVRRRTVARRRTVRGGRR